MRGHSAARSRLGPAHASRLLDEITGAQWNLVELPHPASAYELIHGARSALEGAIVVVVDDDASAVDQTVPEEFEGSQCGLVQVDVDVYVAQRRKLERLKYVGDPAAVQLDEAELSRNGLREIVTRHELLSNLAFLLLGQLERRFVLGGESRQSALERIEHVKPPGEAVLRENRGNGDGRVSLPTAALDHVAGRQLR